MTSPRFEKALHFTLNEEGGCGSAAGDPGGLTNLGITYEREWIPYCKAHNRPVSTPEQFCKELTIPDVMPLYWTEYWQAAGCEQLPPGLGEAVFDFAVNLGVGSAVEHLQRLVRVHPDGMIGPITLAAVHTQNQPLLLQRYFDVRRALYYQIVKDRPNEARFLWDWERRVDHDETFLHANG